MGDLPPRFQNREGGNWFSYLSRTQPFVRAWKYFKFIFPITIITFIITFNNAAYMNPQIPTAESTTTTNNVSIKTNCTLSITFDLNENMPLNSYNDLSTCAIQQRYAIVRDLSMLSNTYNNTRVIYTTFPDSGYLSLQASIYALTMPKYVLYVNSTEVKSLPSTEWIEESLSRIQKKHADILFGGFTEFRGQKVGIGPSIISSDLVRELLYYTNSTYLSIPPLLAISLIRSKSLKVIWNSYQQMKPNINYNYIKGYQSISYQKCPNVNNTNENSFAVLLPLFKRQYIYKYMDTCYENQTLLPKYYVLVQCENRFRLNLTKIKTKFSNVHHIWCYNWSPMFMFPTYISGMIPVDFIMRYDDDHCPFNKNFNYNYVNRSKNKNIIIGTYKYTHLLSNCNNNNKNKIKGCKGNDHVASPIMYRTLHSKISARIRPQDFTHGEDIAMSVTAKLECGTLSVYRPFKVYMDLADGLGHASDDEFKEIKKVETSELVSDIYCYYRNKCGYIPECFVNESTKSRGDIDKIKFHHSEFIKENMIM